MLVDNLKFADINTIVVQNYFVKCKQTKKIQCSATNSVFTLKIAECNNCDKILLEAYPYSFYSVHMIGPIMKHENRKIEQKYKNKVNVNFFYF